MQIILDSDEAWSVMSLVVSQVLDQVELSEEGKAAVRRWRGDRVDGTGEMAELAVTMNEALGTVLDERTQKLLRRKGWYVSTDGDQGEDTGMKVEFEVEEAWDLLNHVIGRMLEETNLTDADRARVRRWKSDEMRATSQEMRVLTTKMNEDLLVHMQRKIKSQLRKPDWV